MVTTPTFAPLSKYPPFHSSSSHGPWCDRFRPRAEYTYGPVFWYSYLSYTTLRDSRTTTRRPARHSDVLTVPLIMSMAANTLWSSVKSEQAACPCDAHVSLVTS